MTQTVEKRRVILLDTRFTYSRNRKKLYLYCRSSSEHDRDRKGESTSFSEAWGGVPDVRDATDLSEMPLDKAMDLFFKIKSLLVPTETIELVDLVLTIETTPVTFDPDEQRDYLRQEAFKKLSVDEVQALGVENLAIYEKLKNHNT